MRARVVAAVCVLLTAGVSVAAEPVPLFPFVLPWDDASPGVTDASGLLHKPAGKFGPVVARDGHLFTGPQRFRIVGVNLCFGANFPNHADADRVAARMAKFGINCVRFHHMDNQPPPAGLLKADKKTLDPGQLDRLDYLIAALKKHGIYADLNLHVSREYPGMPRWEGMPAYFKGVDNFDPTMIALQKDYARDLLTHVNPYTMTRYADEPAVALVEINNENALIHEWWNRELDGMPEPYRGELSRRWNAWLKSKYADADALRRAWSARVVPVGAELLQNGKFTNGLSRWNLETHQGAEAGSAVNDGVLTIRVSKQGRESWHVQVNQSGLAFQADTPYTLTFRARGDGPRRVTVNAMQAHDPWQLLWTADVKLTKEWQTYRYVFQPTLAGRNARVGISDLAAVVGTVEFADFSLRPGGVFGLEPGEALGTMAFIPKADFARRSPEAQRDWMRFLWEVEDQYWSGMYRYLKDDLKVAAPVLGTQMGWSPAPVQAKLDVIDSHSYWQHPHFPRRQWDMADWTVNNFPMAGRSDGGMLPDLALSRVVGKPFICTEYNHSAPNTYSSETLPIIFSYAAMQDWDGVFAFAYSHRHDEWDTGRITGFFDIDQHPTKMATLVAAATLFLRGDLAAGAQPRVEYPRVEEMVEVLRREGPALRADRFGLDRASALLGPVGIDLIGPRVPKRPVKPVASGESRERRRWVVGEKGGLKVDTPRSKLLISRVPGKTETFEGLTITPADSRQGFSVITVTEVDGPKGSSAVRLLITATGLAENTGMEWTSSDHVSVGTHWGERPSVVEGITATVAIDAPARSLHAWALDPRGKRTKGLTIGSQGSRATLELGPKYETLWYEVEFTR